MITPTSHKQTPNDKHNFQNNIPFYQITIAGRLEYSLKYQMTYQPAFLELLIAIITHLAASQKIKENPYS